MRLIRHIGRLSLAGFIALSLVSCGGSTPTIDRAGAHQQIDVDAVLARAEVSQSPQKERLQLQAARQLNVDQQYTRARNLLNDLDPDVLNDSQFAEYTLLFSETALADDSYFLAQRILTNPRLNQQWQSLPVDSQITLHQRRADVFMLLGRPHDSILERIALEALFANTAVADQALTSDTLANKSLVNNKLVKNVLAEKSLIATAHAENPRFANQDVLWQTLMSMPLVELQASSQQPRQLPTQQEEELQGWYSLALLSKSHQYNLDKQLEAINQWAAQWPQHSASQRRPKDLQLLQQLITERPMQVALLLPQQGRLGAAGNAVRDGFMAAYYEAMKQQHTIPALKFYDTSQGSIVDIYQRAVADGAELIIGPLDKDKVVELSQLESLPVPTLAVNYVENHHAEDGQEPARSLYQFGLSTEDEARQIAHRAWIEGHRYAMILTTSASWGQRSADAFREAWEEHGGTVINISQFTGEGDYSSVIKSALHVDLSEQRYSRMRTLLNRPLEFEPRRRQDADMLFLAAQAGEARQIKPTLAFHYASDLEVYATSQIFSGVNDPQRDRDLNDIKFSTLPWYFDTRNAEKQSIIAAANPPASFQRLYALGVDSYHLYPRLKLLEQSPYARLYGVTGSLSMNSLRQIERKQTWAKMVNGIAQPLPAVVQNPDS